jgi:rhodanese-related sulfurtransferase
MKVLAASLAVLLSLSVALYAEDPKPGATATEAAKEHAVQNVTPDEAAKLIQDKKDLVILDVRTPGEFAAGHIAGAQNLDFKSPDFAQKVAALDPSKAYLVHCASGYRSGKTMELMEKGKFSEVYHMKAGFVGWEAAGKPVTK